MSDFEHLIYLKRLEFTAYILVTCAAAWYVPLNLTNIFMILRQHPVKKTQRLTLLFLVATLIVNGVYLGLYSKMETVSLIENMRLPGPDEFTTGTSYCSGTAIAARFVFGRLVIMFNDAFFMFRATVLFKKQLWMMYPSFAAYAALIVLSLMAPLRCVPGHVGKYFTDHTPTLITSFGLLTVGLNVILAIMMTVKLLAARRAAKKAGVVSQGPYLTVVGLIVESALVWAILGILYIVTTVAEIDEKVIFRAFFEMSAGLNPLILIFRVVFKIHYKNPLTPESDLQSGSRLQFRNAGSTMVMVSRTTDVEGEGPWRDDNKDHKIMSAGLAGGYDG